MAVEALQDGGIIVYPTDTQYAMACNALDQRAIQKLCRLKGINPEKNLLSIVCADISQAAQYARIDNRAFDILHTYLPGPFTFVLPATTHLPKAFKGRRTVGIRIPDAEIARALAAELGNPLLSSTLEDNSIEMGAAIENQVDYTLVVNDEVPPEGLSTVVDLTDSTSPEIIRQGIGVIDITD